MKLHFNKRLLLKSIQVFGIGLFALPSLIIFLLFLGPFVGLQMTIHDTEVFHILHEGYTLTHDDIVALQKLKGVIHSAVELSWFIAALFSIGYFLSGAYIAAKGGTGKTVD